MAMHEFHGDLLIGGLALRNVGGVMNEQQDSPAPAWFGRLEVDRCQEEVLEIGRQYLLMLDDGRNREVVLTEICLDEAGGPVVCKFADYSEIRRPK